ncbi:MAG TPA: acyl-CoA dehydrogenase family protein [Nevskiaceae bacterium]|nr:acyl-CoA dehydrogenase family protein [Nevskiaceae bacterium]
MNAYQRVMGAGLKALNRWAGSPLIDRLGLRKASERAVYHASRTGFRTAGTVGRSFVAAQKLLKPARPARAKSGDLFDLTPTDEQQALREAVLNFALNELRPVAAQADHDCAAPAALLQQSAELGLTLMNVPEELGGAGNERNAVTNALVTEALAQGDMGLAYAVLAPSAVSNALVLWGDEQQQAKYLPAFVGDRQPAAAFAMLEPCALFNPFELATTARRSGEHYVLSGVKSLVARAAQAELFIVAAAIEGAGPALFIVESKTPGIGIEAEPAMGLRAAATGRVILGDVKVPVSALLAGGATEIYEECVQLSRAGWCALAVGTAQATLDYVTQYTRERMAFGEPIAHRQSVAFAVANMAIELEGMRLLTWRAASRADEGKLFSREAALARRACADRGMVIGSDGVQLLGGHGFVKDHPVERWYRDLRAAGVMEGGVLL